MRGNITKNKTIQHTICLLKGAFKSDIRFNSYRNYEVWKGTYIPFTSRSAYLQVLVNYSILYPIKRKKLQTTEYS
jgi:hypothetical protein